MIRTLRLVLLLILGLALLTIALANRTPVSVRLLPEDLAALTGLTFDADIPLFLAIFGGIVAGLFIGFVWEWLREMKHRSVASTKSREVTRLERELAVLRDSSSTPKDEVLALLDAPKSR